jgi:hypothetical protein
VWRAGGRERRRASRLVGTTTPVSWCRTATSRLAAALRRVLTDDVSGSACGGALPRAANYTWDAVTDQMQAVIERVVGRVGRSRRRGGRRARRGAITPAYLRRFERRTESRRRGRDPLLIERVVGGQMPYVDFSTGIRPGSTI